MNIYTSLKLEQEPFSISPDPKFFYRSTAHYTALNRLEIAIRLRKGLSLILGDVGTGKTTLSRALFQSFHADENYLFHMILDPSFKSEFQFLTYLTKLFGISPFFRSTIDHRDAIEKYLYEKTVEQGKTVVLVIDEGQKLSLTQLEVLRTLLNYETNEYKMIQIVLLAQMELLPRVKRIHNFMDRINLKYILNPLDAHDTEKMIHFRLRQAGYADDQSLFTREAVQKIYNYTQGYPRQIARICQSAMERLIGDHAEMVTQDMIQDLIDQENIWHSHECKSNI